MDLLSTSNFVEAPFIIATFGEYTFGSYTSKASKAVLGMTNRVTYPDTMKSLEVTKINGQVNTYTLKMVYPITENDDPNKLERVFSSVSRSREMTLTYGDWNNPTSIYRKETALITSVKSNMSMSSSSIEYTISGVSNSVTLGAAIFEFPERTAKPSDVIRELLSNSSYGLTTVFTGMINKSLVNKKNLIASDDAVVTISAKTMSAIDYLVYLVENMTSVTESTNSYIKEAVYQMCIVDDSTNEMGGPYFYVRKLDSRYNIKTTEAGWEIDVGYPGKNFVTGFDINNDESWSILYDYQGKINQSSYVYRIDNDGNITTEESPSIMRSRSKKSVDTSNRTWWSLMTHFPITANLTIKGLIRPTILMDYLKINVVFYGKKHVSSGIYVITKQVDNVSSSGYRTTLSLLRVGGDS